MITNYEVRQKVSSIRKGWFEVIFSTPIERIAKLDFEDVKAAYPNEYFELVKVEHDEECLDFTPCS